MNEVKVDKAKLLATLKENRASHVEEYEEAIEGFRAKAEKALRKLAIDVRDGKTTNLTEVLMELPVPRSYESEYDRAAAMVDWSEDDQITLDEQDFRSFVLDEWNWRGQFVGSTSIYNNR